MNNNIFGIHVTQWILVLDFCLFNSIYWYSAHYFHQKQGLTYEQVHGSNKKKPITNWEFIQSCNLENLRCLVKESRRGDQHGERPIDPYNFLIALILSLPAIGLLFIPNPILRAILLVVLGCSVAIGIMRLRNRGSGTALIFFLVHSLLIGIASVLFDRFVSGECIKYGLFIIDAIKDFKACSDCLKEVRNFFITSFSIYLVFVAGLAGFIFQNGVHYKVKKKKKENFALLCIMVTATLLITLSGFVFFVFPSLRYLGA